MSRHQPSPSRRALVALTAALVHAVGVSVVASGFLLYWGSDALAGAVSAWDDAQIWAQASGDLLKLFGVSSLIWASLYMGWRILSRAPSRPRRVALSRGQVMVETLIVIPVYLLVMLGSMQLALTSIAGLLTTLGAYQAGRAAAIWMPETTSTGNRRSDVTQALAKDKVRVAAASVIAPSVNSGFLSGCSAADSSDTLELKIEALTILPPGLSIAGEVPAVMGNRANLTVYGAFDATSMRTRMSRKLKFAYCALEEPEVTVDGDYIQTRIVFNNHVAMPIVERVFGSWDTVGDRSGYFRQIERTYRVRAQIEPNPISPLQGVL